MEQELAWSVASPGLRDAVEAQGGVYPTPDIPDHLLDVWRAWHRLDMDRPWYGGGMGPMIPGRIPWKNIADWCQFHGHSHEQRELLDACFAEMDIAYISFHNEKAKAELAK